MSSKIRGMEFEHPCGVKGKDFGLKGAVKDMDFWHQG